jgi:hypothetical protein
MNELFDIDIILLGTLLNEKIEEGCSKKFVESYNRVLVVLKAECDKRFLDKP